MRPRFYARSYSAFASTLALIFSLFALCLGGAVASGVIVTGKQIKNGSITSKDLHKSAVRSSDIRNGAVGSSDIKTAAVQSSDIGAGQVTPEDVTMPAPAELKEAGAESSKPTMAYSLLDVIGSYSKVDPTSTLEVDWTGSVEGHNGDEISGCVFQLRVDGQPSPGGVGEVFGKGLTSVSATALFPGLTVGAHQIEVWARLAAQEPESSGDFDKCTVGPPAAGIGQTVVVSEQVI